MAEPMDTAERSADSKERLIPEVQAVRMSLRPPPHFTEATDLVLWLTRFEMYVTQAEIPERRWTKELLPLLAEGPFRLVSQQGLVASENYKEVTQCLRAQYAPEGNQLEWQAKFQRRVQNSGEQLVEYVGHLHMLADRAYPGWTMEQRLELVRNQFIQGVHSSSTQLRLMKEMPESVEEALMLATQQEAVEIAQKRLYRQRAQETLAVEKETTKCDGDFKEIAATVERGDGDKTAERLRRQVQESEKLVQQLKRQLQQLEPGRGR